MKKTEDSKNWPTTPEMQLKNLNNTFSWVKESSKLQNCAEDSKLKRKKCYLSTKPLSTKPKFLKSWRTSSKSWPLKNTKSSSIWTISSRDTTKYFWTYWRSRSRSRLWERTTRCSNLCWSNISMASPSTTRSCAPTTLSSSSTTASKLPRSPSRRPTLPQSSTPTLCILTTWTN